MTDLDRAKAVKKAAFECCQQLYSADKEASPNPIFSTQFRPATLKAAMDRGRDLIQPMIDDFKAVAVTVPLPKGGRGTFYCNIPAKVAHGNAFEIADELLKARRNGGDDSFLTASGIKALWTAIQAEADDLAKRIAAKDQPAPKANSDPLVTLSKLAPLFSVSARTLKRSREKGDLPTPEVKGGSGRADKWRLSKIRPILEERYGNMLPLRDRD